MNHRVDLKLGPGVDEGSLAIDGHDISDATRSVSVEYLPGRVSVATVALAMHNLTLDGQGMDVHLEPSVVDALTVLGWLPPTDDPDELEERASQLLTRANGLRVEGETDCG